MATLNILCFKPLNLKNKTTKIKHKKIFFCPSKIMKNISCSINICLKYFMTYTKVLCLPPPPPPPPPPHFPRPPKYLMDGPLWSGSSFLIPSDFFRLVHCLVQSSLYTESNLHHHFLDLLLIFLFSFFFLFFFTFADTFVPFRTIYVWSTAIDGYLIA